MAGHHRHTSRPVDEVARFAFEELRESLAEAPWRFDFYQVLRRVEDANRELPRIGWASRPTEEPVRLSQDPYMHFAPASVQSFWPGEGGRRDRLTVFFFGVFGPQGPLPLHITEYARQRQYNYGDRSIVRFVDVFHHRFLTFFYRSWADSEPTVSHDRREHDRIAGYVASLVGIGMPALQGRDAMPDLAKLFFAGHLSGSSRHPEGLSAMVQSVLGVPAYIEEFVPMWSSLPEDAQWRLGRAGGPTLGNDTVLGAFVRQVQQRFRVVIGPLEPDAFNDLLPGQPGLESLTAIVRNYIGDELEWEVALIRTHLEPIQLGGKARLGWTSGLAGQRADTAGHRVTIQP